MWPLWTWKAGARERPHTATILGLIISLIGVLLVLTHGDLFRVFAIDYNAGDLFMLMVIISWTFYTLLSNRIKGLPPDRGNCCYRGPQFAADAAIFHLFKFQLVLYPCNNIWNSLSGTFPFCGFAVILEYWRTRSGIRPRRHLSESDYGFYRNHQYFIREWY